MREVKSCSYTDLSEADLLLTAAYTVWWWWSVDILSNRSGLWWLAWRSKTFTTTGSTSRPTLSANLKECTIMLLNIPSSRIGSCCHFSTVFCILVWFLLGNFLHLNFSFRYQHKPDYLPSSFLSENVEILCPADLYRENPDYGLRDVALKIVAALKQVIFSLVICFYLCVCVCECKIYLFSTEDIDASKWQMLMVTAKHYSKPSI